MANRIKVEPQILEQAGVDLVAAAATIRKTTSNVVHSSQPVTGSSELTAGFTGSLIASEALYLFWYSLQQQLTLVGEVFDEVATGLNHVVLKYQPADQISAAEGNVVGNSAPMGVPTPARNGAGNNPPVTSSTVPHQALVPILGNHVALTQLGKAYVDLADQFQGVWDKLETIRNNALVNSWLGEASRSYERAFEVALSPSQHAPRGLDSAAHALYRYAGELAVAQDAHAQAVGQIAILQTDLALDSTNTALETQLSHHVQIAFNAQGQAARSANTFAVAMSDLTNTQWYQIPPLTARFDAVTAAVLDSLVAHRWVSSNDAYLVAQQLETLSPSDYQAFMNAQATASTDAQRGSLYKALAGGQPLSAFTTSPPAPVAVKKTSQPISAPPQPNITGA